MCSFHVDTSWISPCSMRCADVVLGNETTLSVFRGQPFGLVTVRVVWRFQWGLLGLQLNQTQSSPTTESSTWGQETPYVPILRDLISTIVIYFRKFLLHLAFIPPSKCAPSIQAIFPHILSLHPISPDIWSSASIPTWPQSVCKTYFTSPKKIPASALNSSPLPNLPVSKFCSLNISLT